MLLYLVQCFSQRMPLNFSVTSGERRVLCFFMIVCRFIPILMPILITPPPPFWLVIFFLFFSINISSMYSIQHPITSPFVNTLNPGLKYKSVSFPVPIILESRSRGLYIYLCSLVLRPTCTRTWQRARWRTSRLGLLPICLHTSSFKSHRSRAELRVWWM